MMLYTTGIIDIHNSMVAKLVAETLEEEVIESKGAILQELHFYGESLTLREAMVSDHSFFTSNAQNMVRQQHAVFVYNQK